ncbi:hypothetical protein EB809_08420 [Marinobacter sp. R17]|uniref:DUF6160 family protein n=1 Tax=Marinobacter sp. R17 TaxID=2484250 RepID=UPI000F4B126D|nr:DUF6160 family protein [Marinobacter sp. R17]ROT99978.1 hypothetical protein EB809_08420 [Marinobacter sp. R17]
MKGLKKLVLATAVAAAPFAAQAELKAMNDGAMGNVTGQAGVSIELQTEVSVGEFRYTDEGTFAVSGIQIGGASYDATSGVSQGSVTGALDDLLIDIDVEADGDAVIDVHSVSGLPIDYGVAVNEVWLDADQLGARAESDTSTLLASNISMTGDLGQLKMRVDTLTDDLQIGLAFNIRDMDMDIDFLGVGIRDMKLMGATYFESGAGSTAFDPAASDPTAEFNRVFAQAQINIGKGANAAGTDALAISIPSFVADIEVGQTLIGGTNIGEIQLDNLQLTNTSMVVYGH